MALRAEFFIDWCILYSKFVLHANLLRRRIISHAYPPFYKIKIPFVLRTKNLISRSYINVEIISVTNSSLFPLYYVQESLVCINQASLFHNFIILLLFPLYYVQDSLSLCRNIVVHFTLGLFPLYNIRII